MNVWKTLTSNYYINVALVAWFLAQIIKVILTFVTTKKLELERFIGSGGMPSSHSAFTTSVAVAIVRKLGFSSPEFALAFVFASVVMYDAMGVRRAAGEQARVLNRMIFELPDFSRLLSRDREQSVEVDLEQLEQIQDIENRSLTKTGEDMALPAEKELKEFLGHTPLEVLGGSLLGILVALFAPIN